MENRLIDRIIVLYNKLEEIAEMDNSPFEHETTTEARLRKLKMRLFKAKKDGNKQDELYLSQLIETLEEYKRLCIELVSEKSVTLEFDEAEFAFILLHQKDIATDTTCEQELLLDEFGRIYKKYAGSDARKPLLEAVMLAHLIEAYGKDTYYWRAREYTEKLESLLRNGLSKQDIAEHYVLLCEQYEEIYYFYRRVRDVKMAAAALRSASELAFGVEDVKLSAEYLCRALSCELELPQDIRPLYDEAEIRKRYGEYVDVALDIKEGYHLKVDPVEHTEKFLTLYDEVMETVQESLLGNERVRLAPFIWSLISAEYRKRGVCWKDPGQMNPGVHFD
ncbi:MAG: hypothetical protein IKA82_00770 [Clostridia bacterium]|nr:hypothetical protein [Clostridia bacterium]